MDQINDIALAGCFICLYPKVKPWVIPFRGRRIYVCLRCKNAFTFPVPTANYSHDSFYIKSSTDTSEYQEYAQSLLKYILKYMTKGKLLDIGTGGGFLISEALKCGFQAEGVEASKNAVKYCLSKNLRVRQGYFSSKNYPNKSFDCIVMSHVLEHIKNPGKILEEIREILKPNGLLILSQTNYTGTIPSLYGGFWEGLVPMEHYVHFSPFGIEYFLKSKKYKMINISCLPLGYQIRWKWGGKSELANNLYTSISFLISRLKIGLPFVGDQMYIALKT